MSNKVLANCAASFGKKTKLKMKLEDPAFSFHLWGRVNDRMSVNVCTRSLLPDRMQM